MNSTKYNKSEIMKQAHRNYVMLGDSMKNRAKNKTGRRLFTWSECLCMAWRSAKTVVAEARRKETAKERREHLASVKNNTVNTVIYDSFVNAAICAEYSHGRFMGD